MGAPLLRVRVRSAWVLVWAAVALLGAVGYGVYAAVKLATAETTPSFVTGPDDFTGRVGLVLQFNGSGPLVLLLLAGVLLGGCLVLAGRVPAQLAGRTEGGLRPVGGSRLRLSVLGLAALAALFALVYGVAALGVLTTADDTLEEEAFRLLNRGNLVTVLAVSVAAFAVLSLVLLSSWSSGEAPASADEQPEADPEPAAEPPEADTDHVPLPSSADLIESGPAVSRDRRRHPTDQIATEGPGGERS